MSILAFNIFDSIWALLVGGAVGVLAGYIAGQVWPLGWVKNRGQDATGGRDE